MSTNKKEDHLQKPEMQLHEIWNQLHIINLNMVQFKIGVGRLIQAVDENDLKTAKKTVDVFELKKILENLTK